jgi:hypothetical protein
MIQRSTTCTATSALALFCGFTRPRLRPALEEEDRSQRQSILRHVSPLVGKIDNFTSLDKLL